MGKIKKQNISTVSKHIKMEITKKNSLCCYCCYATLPPFGKPTPPFSMAAALTTLTTVTNYQIQNPKARIPHSQIQNQKSKAASTGRGSMGLQGLQWTYPGFKQNYRNTKRSGIIQTSEGLKWPSILTIMSEMVFRKEGVSTIKGLE